MDEWVTVPPQSLEIPSASPLDFSALVPVGPAGTAGPLRLVDDHATFTGRDRPARFNCAMLANGPNMTWDFPTHTDSDALAIQLRRHGYNLVRFHYVDARLMHNGRRDFEVDGEELDRFQYLLAAIKKQGIYWMLDVQTAYDAGVAGALKRPMTSDSLKIRLNFDPTARTHWAKLLDTLYNVQNPYTGLTTLADPALAFVIGANENSLAFGSLSNPSRFPEGLGPRFDSWVRSHFTTPATLTHALPDLTTAERDGGPIGLPNSWDAVGPRLSLFLRFVADQEVETYRWMQALLAERGFHGPLLAYPEWYRQATGETRARLPIVDVHAYVGEVTSYSAGAAVELPSSTSDEGLADWTTNAGARWLDRPFVTSEYGVPVPNPYRFEGGALFPSLAALQGYSAICRMADMSVAPAIQSPGPNAKGLFGYSVGIDPTSRAAETLATLLFYRGDVKASTATIAVPFGPTEFARAGAAFLPKGIRRAALLGRFGLIAPDHVKKLKPPVRMVALTPSPYAFPQKFTAKLTNLLTDSADAQFGHLIADLRADGTLPRANTTDPAAGLFQSGTGELTIDQSLGRIEIVTPRTEAISSVVPADAVTLRRLSIRAMSSATLLVASALDGRSLSRSRHILLILSGNTVNTGLRLMGTATGYHVQNWGTLPMLMRRVKATLSLFTGLHDQARFSVLSLRGTRMLNYRVPVSQRGEVLVDLDTSKLPSSPTTFFFLDPEPQTNQ